MGRLDKKTQVFQALYGEDSPTLLLRPKLEKSALETSTAEVSPLSARIRRALEKKVQLNPRETASMSAISTSSDKLFYGKQAPTNPVHDAPIGPFNQSYVFQRLNQAILDAQVNCHYDEAIRLQLLCFKLQDEEISPIQAAREAWLRPLRAKSNEETVANTA